MPWESGQFTRTDGTRTGSNVWADARDANIKINASPHDTHDQDLADGIDACLAKDGSNKPTGDLDFNGKKITNVAAIAYNTSQPIKEVTVEVFAAGGTWSKPANLLFAIVEGVGGGGGAGGAEGGGAGVGACSGGGGAGAFFKVLIPASELGATETVTIGAGGSGGVGVGDGTDGGTTSFGSHATAPGGKYSSGKGAGGNVIGPPARRSNTPTISSGTTIHSVSGGGGHVGLVSDGNARFSGAGGASFYGGDGDLSATGTVNSSGTQAETPGAGGSGASISASSTDRQGGDGADGIIVVHCFIGMPTS